jgi:hypothetical protein
MTQKKRLNSSSNVHVPSRFGHKAQSQVIEPVKPCRINQGLIRTLQYLQLILEHALGSVQGDFPTD